MKEETLDLRQLIGILKRNWVILFLVPVLGVTIAVMSASRIPKRFKSTALLNIQGSYFQNPLINDLIAQVTDPSELQSQRMSLLRLSLNQEFLEALGAKYNIFTGPPSDPKHALERELFEKSIEYYSMSPTNFQIAVSAGSPETAQALTRDVLEQMKHTLIEERYSNLIKTRDAIRAHVETLGKSLKQISNPHSAETLADELDKIETTLKGMLTTFSETHPDVIKLRKEEAALKSQLRSSHGTQENSSGDSSEMPAVGAISKQPTQDIFNDLLKKLSYLTVVLDMEKDKQNVSYLGVIEQPSLPIRPFFPDKKLFAAVGLGAGVLLSLIAVFLKEVRRNLHVAPFEAAQILDTALLGELPLLEIQTEQVLLPPPPPSTAQPALPGGGLKGLPG